MKPIRHRRAYIFTTLYHNVSNQSDTEDDDTEHNWGRTNVVGYVRLIISDVLVHREVSMNATVAQRRQQLYVLTGTRKVHIS